MLQHGGASLDEPEAGGEGAPHQSGPRGWPLGEAPEGGTPEVPPMPNDTGRSCWGWCSLLGLQMWSHT